MTRMVNCVVLGTEAPGLERVPYPGELGQRIFDNVSAEGWAKWVEKTYPIFRLVGQMILSWLGESLGSPMTPSQDPSLMVSRYKRYSTEQ